jgi:hypothetical protein
MVATTYVTPVTVLCRYFCPALLGRLATCGNGGWFDVGCMECWCGRGASTRCVAAFTAIATRVSYNFELNI